MSICDGSPHEERLVISPFSRLIATGYYDGPTEGFVECAESKKTFVFKMLDWDDGQDIRVFQISKLLDVIFEDLAIALSSNNTPRWPIWILHSINTQTTDEYVERMLKRSIPVGLAVARNLLDLIMLWKPVDYTFQEVRSGCSLEALGFSRKISD